MRRKGELSRSAINRGWPWQVPVDANVVSARHVEVTTSAAHLGACERTGSIVIRTGWHVVFCFTDEPSAIAFAQAWGAEVRHASTRERGLPWSVWRRGDL